MVKKSVEDEAKKFSKQLLGKTIVSKTGKRFGEVGDLIFETKSGELIHMVLEKFHAEVKRFDSDHAFLENALLRIFRSRWQGNPADGEEQRTEAFSHQYPTALQRETIRRRTEDILRRYIRTEMNQSHDNEIIECEKNIEFLLGGYPFVARIDRVDAVAEGHHIVDYKTSSSGPMGAKAIKRKFLNIDDKPDYAPRDFQLPLYL